jgi:hypothetical protein
MLATEKYYYLIDRMIILYPISTDSNLLINRIK